MFDKGVRNIKFVDISYLINSLSQSRDLWTSFYTMALYFTFLSLGFSFSSLVLSLLEVLDPSFFLQFKNKLFAPCLN